MSITRSIGSNINSEDNPEVSVYDNNNEQINLMILRELRKMNVHLQVMTDEELIDGDFDATN